MSKLGCSLNEAYGESWTAGPKYYQTSPERFRIQLDPYSSNVFAEKKENFVQEEKEEESDTERIRMLEAKVESMNSQRSSQNISQSEERFINFDSETVDRIDNVVRFALIAILISNFLDLISIE